MRSFFNSSSLVRMGLVLCAGGVLCAPSLLAQYRGGAEPAEEAEWAVAPPAGRAPLNGVISYTYFAGATPTGRPLPGPPVDAGTYTVVGTFRSADGNYTGGSTCTTFTIQRATPQISLQPGGGAYNGSPMPATGAALAGRPAARRVGMGRVELDDDGVPIPVEPRGPAPMRGYSYAPRRAPAPGYRTPAPALMEVDEEGMPVRRETPPDYRTPAAARTAFAGERLDSAPTPAPGYVPAPGVSVRRVEVNEAGVPVLADASVEVRTPQRASEPAPVLQPGAAYAPMPAPAPSAPVRTVAVPAPAAVNSATEVSSPPPAWSNRPSSVRAVTLPRMEVGEAGTPVQNVGLPAPTEQGRPANPVALPRPATDVQPVKAVVRTEEPPPARTVPDIGRPTPLPAPSPLDFPPTPPVVSMTFVEDRVLGPRVWGGVDYLMWWMKGTPLPFPVVTTSSAPGTNTSGALDQAATSVLFGGQDTNFGLTSGVRVAAGGWLDSEEQIGVEGELFFLQNQSSRFSSASDAAGNPPIYLPAFNTQLQAERALIVADPVTGLNGNVSVSSSSSLWGADVHGIANVFRGSTTTAVVLCGFRHLNLQESFELANSTSGFGVTDTLRDTFETSNQFYGGTLGSRITYQRGPFIVSFTEKLSVGATHQIIRTAGNITETGAGAPNPGIFPGGFYTQPTNIGVQTRDPFAVVPEVQVRLGYRFRPTPVTAFIGYDFIYWSNVVRPGDQIDRNLNLSQSTIFGGTGGVLTGAASPRPLFNRSDFWAQGLNFGLSVQY